MTAGYWEERYAQGGNSGRGSRGKPAVLKAGFVNRAVEKHKISSLLDIGCGDGYVASMIQCRGYLGTDPSPAAIAIARRAAPHHSFSTWDGEPREAHLSMDVIRHLVDDDAYHHHIEAVFAAKRVAMVWSSNQDRPWSSHEYERRWTPDVPEGWWMAERSGRGVVGSRFYVFLRR